MNRTSISTRKCYWKRRDCSCAQRYSSEPTRSTIMKHLEFEEYNDKRSYDCTCFVPTTIPMSLPQMNAPRRSHLMAASDSVRVSAMQVSESQQVKQLSEVYPNKKPGSPVTTQKMMLMSEPYTYYQESLQSSHRQVDGLSTSTVNAPISPTILCKMVPFSGTSPDLPPVLHLHKEPVAVTFPAQMFCVISPRSDRPRNRKPKFLRK